MLFCITASNYEGGDMNEWLIEDLEKTKIYILQTIIYTIYA